MKRRILPQRISLNELPDDGREFLFDREGAELNSSLKDLIGDNPYSIEFELKPMGNVYLLKGQVSTELDLQCSRCGIDFKQKVSQPVSEFLMVESNPLGRGDTTSRVNHTSDLAEQGQEFTLLESPQFDVGEFFHEIIALSEPIQPLGGENCGSSCENLLEAYKNGWLTPPNEPQEKEIEQEQGKHRPFLALKDLKLS